MSLPPLVSLPPGPPRLQVQFDNAPDIRADSPLPVHDELDEEPDIYRGDGPSTHQRPASPHASLSSSPSSSSSEPSVARGRRRGTLGALVEHAISRWARRSSGSSSGSSSASTSSSSSTTSRDSRSASKDHQKRRRDSTSSLANLRLNLESYTARKRAIAESKLLAREFVLLLPTALTALPPKSREQLTTSQTDQQRILRTTSVRLILAQLDAALKRGAKLDRPARLRGHDIPVDSGPSSVPRETKARKGKAKDVTSTEAGLPGKRAWWLDVSSPTWSDMRALGKLLHLHPLTLEDILQQDPREKLELFPKLGYYFVSFRAIESERSRSLGIHQQNVALEGVPAQSDGAVTGVNVYLVVFKEGICSFHFEDVADHCEHVRRRVMELESSRSMTSDWICHGILDSIVDGFFPIFHNIENEVDSLDELVVSIGAHTDKEVERDRGIGDVSDLLRVVPGGAAIDRAALASSTTDKTVDERAAQLQPLNDKRTQRTVEFSQEHTHSLSSASHKSPSRLLTTMLDLWRRQLVSMLPFRRLGQSRQAPPTRKAQTLLRMTSTRRLVTSLGRLLATKHEVVAQIQKRLHHVGRSDLDWGGSGANAEVAIYMGDVQDHIIYLQQSLAHYERILGHSHPAYLSHLKLSFSQARGGIDKGILVLSTLTVGILCMQVLIGIFSMNVTLPQNHAPGPLNIFGAVVAGTLLIALGVGSFVTHRLRRAKRRLAVQHHL